MVAIVCGALALIVSGAIVLDGTGAVFPGEEFAYYIIGLGWGGIALSMAVMAVSAWALGKGSRLSSAYVALVSLAGAMVGGTPLISAPMGIAFFVSALGMFAADEAQSSKEIRSARS